MLDKTPLDTFDKLLGTFNVAFTERSSFFVEFKSIVAHVSNKGGRGSSGVVPMIALVFENLKLIMLFMFIGTIIGLSHLRGEALTHMKQEK